MRQLPNFTHIIKRPITLEQRIDKSLASVPRPLKHLSLEELRSIVDELAEETRLICGTRRLLR